MTPKIFIVGIGMTGALGADKADTLLNLTDGVAATNREPRRHNDARDPNKSISQRLLRKIDIFTQYALAASDMAIADSGIDDSPVDPERVGVFVGNCFGGWARTDTELRALYTKGVAAVTPYQATSWFPAAPQGQITIKNGFKGFSKTISADRLSGLIAIGEAYHAIAAGRLDAAVVGACEALENPYVAAVLERRGDQFGPCPFDNTFHLTPTEGAAFLVIASEQAAAAMGAAIYGEISGFSSGFCASGRETKSKISHVIQNSLSNRAISDAKRLVFMDGIADEERAAANAVYAQPHPVELKSRLGNMFSVAGVMECALALLALSQDVRALSLCGLRPHDHVPRHASVHGSAGGGGFCALQLSAVY